MREPASSSETRWQNWRCREYSCTVCTICERSSDRRVLACRLASIRRDKFKRYDCNTRLRGASRLGVPEIRSRSANLFAADDSGFWIVAKAGKTESVRSGYAISFISSVTRARRAKFPEIQLARRLSAGTFLAFFRNAKSESDRGIAGSGFPSIQLNLNLATSYASGSCNCTGYPTVARAPRLRLDAFVPTVNDSRSGQAHILERS